MFFYMVSLDNYVFMYVFVRMIIVCESIPFVLINFVVIYDVANVFVNMMYLFETGTEAAPRKKGAAASA